MAKKTTKLSVSAARKKLTSLDRIIKSGEAVEITRRGKRYARIELIEEKDRYSQVMESIAALPKPKGRAKDVARHYKKHLYGKNK